jgi:hypothetical protein
MRRAGSARGLAYQERGEALRERGVREREDAVRVAEAQRRGRLLRRIGIAGLLLLVGGAALALKLITDRERETREGLRRGCRQ